MLLFQVFLPKTCLSFIFLSVLFSAELLLLL